MLGVPPATRGGGAIASVSDIRHHRGVRVQWGSPHMITACGQTVPRALMTARWRDTTCKECLATHGIAYLPERKPDEPFDGDLTRIAAVLQKVAEEDWGPEKARKVARAAWNAVAKILRHRSDPA